MTPEALERAIANLDHKQATLLSSAAAEDARAEAATDPGTVVAARAAARVHRQDAAELQVTRAGWSARLEAARASHEAQRQRVEEEEADRQSAALAKRIKRDVPKLAEAYADIVRETEIDRKRWMVLNVRRRAAGLPYIEDAEERVRRQPAYTIPATYREEVVWVDDQGRQPSQIRTLANGRRVDMSGSPLREETRQVQQSAERFEPARMPKRLADAVVLPSLDGRATLWPR